MPLFGGTRRLVERALLMALAAALAACTAEPSEAARATIHIDPSARSQEIRGWEATAQAGQEDSDYPLYRDELLDLAVDYLGIDRLRLEVRSGAENRRDLWSEYQAGSLAYADWRAGRYATFDDNDDPRRIDRRGFHFSELDHTVRTVVEPMRMRWAERGGRLTVSLNYVAFTTQIGAGGRYHHDDPEEYAEFILATFLHLQRTWGWTPDALEVLLEPDNVPQWTGETVGRALVAAHARLAERGFEVELLAPSNTSMAGALSYFDGLAAVPGALEVLDTFSYHRYRGVSRANLQEIARRAALHDLDTAMLEHIGSGYADLHEDLAVGGNSLWQQFTLGGPEAKNDGGSYFLLDRRNPARPRVVPADRTRYLRQCFAYVRRGAVRIGARSGSKDFSPLAFEHPDGRIVVLVEARRKGRFLVKGLPAGEYEVSYTVGRDDASPAVHDGVVLPPVDLKRGRPLRLRVPSSGHRSTYGVVTVQGGASGP